MRNLLALLAVIAFVAAPLADAQKATPSPSPAASAPHHKRTKKAPATATATPAPTATPAAAPTATPKAAAKTTPAPAGGAGQVWVNTETHVYHKQGSKWYGKTKQGKYLSEADAIKEGDHAAKNEK